VGGIIVGLAHFASKPKKQMTTSLFIAASPQEIESFLKIGLAYTGSTQGNGQALAFKIGGLLWWRGKALIGRGWHR
jgi:hypothetical protein